jgi:hypothetical protein
MSDTDDDDQRKWEQRQRGLDEIRRIHGEALVAHSMTDQESAEALLVLDLEDAYADIDKRLGK